jgi:hypothetical protein
MAELRLTDMVDVRRRTGGPSMEPVIVVVPAKVQSRPSFKDAKIKTSLLQDEGSRRVEREVTAQATKDDSGHEDGSIGETGMHGHSEFQKKTVRQIPFSESTTTSSSASTSRRRAFVKSVVKVESRSVRRQRSRRSRSPSPARHSGSSDNRYGDFRKKFPEIFNWKRLFFSDSKGGGASEVVHPDVFEDIVVDLRDLGMAPSVEADVRSSFGSQSDEEMDDLIRFGSVRFDLVKSQNSEKKENF